MKYKKLKDFSIKDFNTYQELLKDVDENMPEIMEMFGINKSINEMSISEFNQVTNIIKNELPTNQSIGVEREYVINGKRYSTCLDIMKISAGQFIAIQAAVQTNQLQKILGCFLIPSKKSWLFGKYVKQKFGDDYSLSEVEDDIFNHFKIGDAMALSFFFMRTSTKLQILFSQYSEKKMTKKIMKMIKNKK